MSRAPVRAEPLWRRLIGLTTRPLAPGLQVVRARALANCGEAEKAYSILREALDAGDEIHPSATALLTDLLIATGHKAEAARALALGVTPTGASAGALNRLRLQCWIRDTQGARVENFAAAMDGKLNVVELTALLNPVPEIFESYERGEIWRDLRTRAASLPTSDPRVADLQLTLDLALRNYDAFLARLKSAINLPEARATSFRRVAEVLAAPQFPDFLAPKVFGIGLSRTGTSSLGRALERLGYLQAHFLPTPSASRP